MDALVPPTKVSCGFRQGKKKRKKGAHIGYIDKKPRQRMKNKKASSPPPEEESTPAVERPVVNEPLLPVEPAVEPAVLAPAIQPCALFVSPPALSVSPPGEDDDPLSDESIAKMSPKEFAAFLASQMTHQGNHDPPQQHIPNRQQSTNQVHCCNSKFCRYNCTKHINRLAVYSNPAKGSPVKPQNAAVKKYRSIGILNKAINEIGNSDQAALAISTLLQTKQKL
jgi:hypothetical protein